MKRRQAFLAGMVVIAAVAPLVAGLAFIATHPKCEVCGKRYGPLVPHQFRHPTSRKKQWQRMAATAPVINSLPPLTDANRDLVLSAELLAGRWESQDGSRNPLVFRVDGTVEAGTVRNDGQWQMATGEFTIEEGKVVTNTTLGGAHLHQTFNFDRGVLFAPRGPSPRVVWERVGGLGEAVATSGTTTAEGGNDTRSTGLATEENGNE